MNNILSIKNLSKKYYSKDSEILAIKNININVKENDFIAIVGPSGCGKSTLLSILSNIDKPTTGTIEYPNGYKKIGYMLQQDCLFPWLSILDNCLIGLKIQKELTKDKKNKVINMLKKYGLENFIYKYPNSLSGGMKQRVALIRTLATNPDILLLDEAFSALDYQTRLKVSDDVYKIIKKEHKTTIMVTHDVAEAISMANKVIIMSNRPSTIKKIIDINLTDATSPINNRKCKEFTDYYNEIWKNIDNNV
ncbi:MAG: ABC transporter ATP-binding protein [Bacilli bacterium]|nr:ABC transporter ATP-binding protein [Bacilli bacterium]